jgi:hypothetical protein
MDITLLIISLLSLLLAAAMSAVAWRMVRDERLRSAARVAALAAEIHEGVDGRPAAEPELALNVVAPRGSSEMFSATRTTGANSRLALAAMVGALLVGAAATIGILGGGQTPVTLPPAEPSSGTSGSGVADRAAAGLHKPADPGSTPHRTMPLELVALGHEREARGLTVRGVIRNPAGGADVDHLIAVVLLFNGEGGYIASGRAAVGADKLSPGGETTFVVTVAGAPDVERYRVSFRTERDVIPHVDVRS